MKTAVVQSFRHDAGGWIRRCTTSVEAWAALKGFDYIVAADASGQMLGSAGLRSGAPARPNRYKLVREVQSRGYDRVVWVDADVLVFRADLFDIDIFEDHAMARETRVVPDGAGWTSRAKLTPSVFVRIANVSDFLLRFHFALARLTRDFGVHRTAERAIRIADRLLRGRRHSLEFETLHGVASFSGPVVRAIAQDRDEAIAAHAFGHAAPVFAAGLAMTGHGTPAVSERDADAAIDRLLETKGDIVNRWLLQSSNSLLGTGNRGMAALFPPETLVRLQIKQKYGFEPDLANPRTYNERIAARKLTLTDEIYRMTVDKYEVRKFVETRVGRDVLIPLLHVYDRADDVDFDVLPSAFILKPTHGSGWKLIVRDKARLDRAFAGRTMRSWLRKNFYDHQFEVQYRDIRPRIVAEQLLRTNSGAPPDDFRLFVFNGRVRVISAHKRTGMPDALVTRFDENWRQLLIEGRRPSATFVPKPRKLAEMIEIAEALARDFEFARIDLYVVDDKVYFGEITHTPLAGLSTMKPPGADEALGRLWETGEPIPEEFYAPRPVVPAALPPAARTRETFRRLSRLLRRARPSRLAGVAKARIKEWVVA